MYIDWQLAVNGRNVVKNDKKKKKKIISLKTSKVYQLQL